MLVPPDKDNRCPYIAISPDYNKFIHFCPEHISISPDTDTRSFKTDYILTTRTFLLDMHLVNRMCAVWADHVMDAMTIHFGGPQQINIWSQNSELGSYPRNDFVRGDQSLISDMLLKHLYPIFEPIHQYVLAV
jgi:hypothetical protein